MNFSNCIIIFMTDFKLKISTEILFKADLDYCKFDIVKCCVEM